ncbi:hypothetical protein BMF94_2997 [Rhodotorula taiwanensis]|uniref:DNA-directed RNA polymerase III subunit RPC9 n=1 Tax=Rhodotorula taiwanensis TaxID=741276 RepID=A0A2S5BB12_9BASI|nr:hypothetical protein BMF94_2997 [Rhodotorula taiwanensis]
METLNDRAGFLSNYEVLRLLRQQQQDRIIQLKHLTGGKIGDVGGNGKDGKRPRYQDIAQREEAERIQPQDLHTVSWEAVQYLEADVHPTRRQSRDGISHLLDGLAADFKLTKSERLQIVNLAPTSLVELHVCIDDLADRYTDEQQEALLDLVRSHLSSTAAPETSASLKQAAAQLPAAAAEAPDLNDVPDETAEELDEEMAFIDEAYGGVRANEQVENDIDEVGES